MAVVPANSSNFAVLPEDPMVRILMYLDYPSLVQIFRTSHWGYSFREMGNNRLERANFEAVEIFDQVKWKEHWDKKITDEFDPQKLDIRVVRVFLNTYWGPSPVGTGRVKDNCLMPTVVIEGLSLDELEDLAEYPKAGYAARFKADNQNRTLALQQHGATKTDKTCLSIVMKIPVLNAKTQGGWETESDATSLVANVFAHHAVSGERFLSNVYVRTCEIIRYALPSFHKLFHMVTGIFTSKIKPDGTYMAELGVYTGFTDKACVVFMKKFYAQPDDDAAPSASTT